MPTDPQLPAALLSVHNTGSTIPSEDLPRIFERFYQVDKSRAAGSGGLGLAISREIVQAHGGECWAESSPETGAEFFVSLPGLKAVAAAQPRPTRMGDHRPTSEVVIPMGSARPFEG